VSGSTDPAAAAAPSPPPPPLPLSGDRLFAGWLLGGFECSTPRLRSGKRLDLIASTRHDEFAREDYRRLRRSGMHAARDGIRWTRIEPQAGAFDFASARPMIAAAREEGVRVIWDLLHFGWPDHVDPMAPEFPGRFGEFVGRFAEVLRQEGETAPAVCPVNGISFLSFAGGEAGFFHPFLHRHGDALKAQLVRAAIAGCRAMRSAFPNARLVHVDPLIHVVEHPDRPQDHDAAAAHREAQFHAWDMIAGRRCPELGGEPEYLDVIGINYYVHNQWYYPGGHGSMISPSSRRSRPLHEMLVDVHRRYGRPIFIAETGIEDAARPAWLAYVGHEARAAVRQGVNLEGICLYPVVDHPGWEDDRHCHNGLWDYADDRGERAVDAPLLAEVARQCRLAERLDRASEVAEDTGALLASVDEMARSMAQKTLDSREG